MKKIVMLSMIFVGTAFATFYKIGNIRRIETNLYKYDGGYIETKYCYEYVYGEDAIFNDNTNEIIFNNGSKCSVSKFLN